MAIQSIFLYEFGRRTLLNNFSLFQNNNFICTSNSTHTMCNNKNRLSFR